MNFPNSQEVDESGQKKLVLHNIFLLCISILIGLLAYGQFVIALNSDVTPADNSFFACRYDVISTDNSLLVLLARK